MEHEGKITVMGLEINTIRGRVSSTERAEVLVCWRLHLYHPMAWHIEGEIEFNVRKKNSFHILSRVWPKTQACQPRKALSAWNTCCFMFWGLCFMPDPQRPEDIHMKQPFLLRDLLASFPHCIFLTALSLDSYIYLGVSSVKRGSLFPQHLPQSWPWGQCSVTFVEWISNGWRKTPWEAERRASTQGWR